MSTKRKRSLLKCDCSAKRINGGICTCEVDLVVEEEEDLEKINIDIDTDIDTDTSNSDSIFDDDSILNRPSI